MPRWRVQRGILRDNPVTMNWLGFVAAVIQGLAWPLVVLVLGLVFRTEIKNLLTRPLERLELGPFKANWMRVLAEVETNVVDVRRLPRSETTRESGAKPQPIQVPLKGLVKTDPAAAVFAAHELIYKRLQDITGEEEGNPPLPRTAAALARVANERGLISPETLRAIEGITVLRNLAAHGGPGSVTPDRAQEYIANVEALLYVLQEVGTKRGDPD